MPNLKRYRISLQAIENKLNNVQSEIDEVLLLSEKSIEICIKGLRELRDVVIEKGFQNREAEIIFFKEIKPKIVSNLIYNNNIYTIETNRPNGSTKIKRKYIQMELRKLKNFFYENLDFYRYGLA